MASPNAPKTSADLIHAYSQACVVTPSRKVFATAWDPDLGSRRSPERIQSSDDDAVEAMARKYGR